MLRPFTLEHENIFIHNEHAEVVLDLGYGWVAPSQDDAAVRVTHVGFHTDVFQNPPFLNLDL